MSKIRVGVLGAARITPSALLTPALAHRDVEVRCVAARDPERAKVFAETHGIPVVEGDYAALIARRDIDLIYNPLPPLLHADWSIRALEAGKAVLCEKPFTISGSEAKRMVRASEMYSRPLMEAFHYCFHPVMRRAIELVAQRSFGRVTGAEALFVGAISYPDTLWNAGLGCGALTDVGCYPIHALRTLLGEPAVLSGVAREKHGAYGELDVRLNFPGDVPGRIYSALRDDRPSGSRECWLKLEGTRGWMRVTNFVVPHVHKCEFTTSIDGVERNEPVDGPTTYEAQLNHVVDVLKLRASPRTGGMDAVANMLAIDAIRAATGNIDGFDPHVALQGR